MNTLSLDVLNELFYCNAKTGKLYSKINRKPHIKEFDELGTFSHGYLSCRVNYKHYLVHRIIWAMTFKEWPQEIDHINGDESDNRIENLREVTRQENSKNKKIASNSWSKIYGVRWVKQRQKWIVQMKINSKTIHFGCFDNLLDAACCRKAAEIEYGYHKNHGRVT